MNSRKPENEHPRPEQDREIRPVIMDSENETENREGDTAITNQPSPIRRWLSKLADPMVVVTLLLFLATLGLYCSTRTLVTDAEETARYQLRAYVGFKGVGKIRVEESDLPPKYYAAAISITWINNGNSQTSHLGVWGSCGLSAWHPWQANGAAPKWSPAHFVLSAKQEWTFVNCWPDATHLDEFVGGRYLYVFGIATYNDAVTPEDDAIEKHKTRYCVRLSSFRQKSSFAVGDDNAPTFQMDACPREGNCSDKECDEEDKRHPYVDERAVTSSQE